MNTPTPSFANSIGRARNYKPLWLPLRSPFAEHPPIGFVFFVFAISPRSFRADFTKLSAAACASFRFAVWTDSDGRAGLDHSVLARLRLRQEISTPSIDIGANLHAVRRSNCVSGLRVNPCIGLHLAFSFERASIDDARHFLDLLSPTRTIALDLGSYTRRAAFTIWTKSLRYACSALLRRSIFHQRSQISRTALH